MKTAVISGYEAELFEAWKKFVERAEIDSSIISPLIRESWQHSKEFRVDPYQTKIPSSQAGNVKDYQGVARNKRKKKLIGTVSPFMQLLNKETTDAGIVITLSDEKGYLLTFMGDRRVISSLEMMGIKNGTSLQEEYAGTNCVGLALSTKSLVSVHSFEHYCRIFHPFNSVAIPVYNLSGVLEGILAIIGMSASSHSRHLSCILMMLISSIERDLRLARIVPQAKSFSKYFENTFEGSAGIILLTEHGYIKQINAQAMKILHLDSPAKLEKPIDKIVRFKPPLLELLTREKELKRKRVEIQVDKDSLSAWVEATPISVKTNKMWTVTLTSFKEKDSSKMIEEGIAVRFTFRDIIGESEAMKDVKKKASKAASTSVNVLLEGPSGTGKEMFAQAIHNASPRRSMPLIVVNCAAIPRDLVNSELFGYEEGAFTGAKKGGQIGKFEAADGGTIFLDEIGDMPLELQAELLRVLESKYITRVGGYKEIPVDIRIIAASTKDLLKESRAERFREDLYYRLSVTKIVLPSLNQTREDIPLLIEHYLHLFNEMGGQKIKSISPKLMPPLINYEWPGNVRELRNMIEYAFTLEEGEIISWSHLPDEIRESLLYHTKIKKQNDLLSHEREELEKSTKHLYEHALKLADGNVSKAAKILGIGRTTLYRKIKEYQS